MLLSRYEVIAFEALGIDDFMVAVNEVKMVSGHGTHLRKHDLNICRDVKFLSHAYVWQPFAGGGQWLLYSEWSCRLNSVDADLEHGCVGVAMTVNEDVLRDQIVKLLENSFILRKPVDPNAVARELVRSVDLPLDDLANRVTMVARGLGVGLIER